MLSSYLICLVIVLDEGNRVAQNGIEGALNYVERNNLVTIGSKTFLTLAEEEPFQTVERGKIMSFSKTNKQLLDESKNYVHNHK